MNGDRTNNISVDSLYEQLRPLGHRYPNNEQTIFSQTKIFKSKTPLNYNKMSYTLKRTLVKDDINWNAIYDWCTNQWKLKSTKVYAEKDNNQRSYFK